MRISLPRFIFTVEIHLTLMVQTCFETTFRECLQSLLYWHSTNLFLRSTSNYEMVKVKLLFVQFVTYQSQIVLL